jgi:glycosyltransferase involved in cell wall biosynthesis
MAQEAKSIGIVTCTVPGANCWDPDSIKNGITGSEEAVIYMAEKLAKLGYTVTVLGNPPAESPFTSFDANPRYTSLNAPEIHQFDIAISWRMPKEAERLKKYAPFIYLWPHDTCNTRLTDEEIKGFTDVLWLSDWQREQWMSINPSFAPFTNILGNGINEDQFQAVKEKSNPYSCIYGSNYARGLEILLDIWPAVKHQFPKASLDIYYGWQHWGLLSKAKEKKMRKQIDTLYRLDVQEHGLVGHEELNRAYEKASFWTYPCIAPETFCISALKAQMAGAIPVIIEGSALKETVRYGYRCNTPKEYLSTILKAMGEVENKTMKERESMSQFVRHEYTWDAIALKWKALFETATDGKR